MKVKTFLIGVKNTAATAFTVKATTKENALRNAKKALPVDWARGRDEFTIEEMEK